MIQKTKNFGCVGKADLNFVFKTCEMDSSHGRLV